MNSLIKLAILGAVLYFGAKYVLARTGDIASGASQASTERHLRMATLH